MIFIVDLDRANPAANNSKHTDAKEEAAKQGFCGMFLTEYRLIGWMYDAHLDPL